MTPGQQQRKDRQDEARRQQQADERIRELEDLIRHFMSLTHPEFGRAHDHPEFALHAIHARCAIEVGEYEDEVEAYAKMDVSDRSKPTRHDLEEEVKLLREAHMEIVRAVDAEQQNHDPEWSAMAGYAKGTALRALNGHPPDALDGGGDSDE